MVVGHGRALEADAGIRGRTDIATNGFRVHPQLRGEPLGRHPRAPESQDFFDFQHGDLAIHPGLLAEAEHGVSSKAPSSVSSKAPSSVSSQHRPT